MSGGGGGGGVFAYCIKIQAQRWGVNGVDRAYIRFHTDILREEHAQVDIDRTT